ncbi:MAG: DUF5107 domain-containing protein [Spirochaetaceae bacterium]
METKSPYIFNVPAEQKNESVKLWNSKISIPTYEVGEAEHNPMFFEKRVYQGSCGKVYPIPYIDKVSDDKIDKEYDGIFLENDYVRFIILPELGGRIQIGQDKTNNNYDFFYRNDVIKPALVGLAGPWLSGGVEFNWPQHHRPGTYMPVEYTFEIESDGTKTVWLSDHDPMERMKGMIGLSLKPDSSVLQAKVRLYNRTEDIKTFLWWANVAAEVHDEYQSFFPPDVNYVADHAARAMSEFPLAKDIYYGIDYAPGTDISRYKNIPVPTSYMVVETEGEFFGGYDFKQEGGFVHVANRHISPGKKQWTWGNSEFGWNWDKNLTDDNGPYVELMAGVYTNNQPDFTYLMPGETKTFTQTWFPIQGIGIAHQANLFGAVHLSYENGTVKTGVCCTSQLHNAQIIISYKGEKLDSFKAELEPGKPFTSEIPFNSDPEGLSIKLISFDGKKLIEYTINNNKGIEELPEAAKETPEPKDLESTEDLYLAGEHLNQYRHPTRYPEDYWKEALRRDPGDIRCNTAMGQYHLSRFEYKLAETYFRSAIERLTSKHPNPIDGEAFYGLGLALKKQNKNRDAYAAFYKSTWNYAWRSAGYFEVALLDIKNNNIGSALEHLDQSINYNYDNFKAWTLKAAVLRNIGKYNEALNICLDIIKKDKLFLMAHNELLFIFEKLNDSNKLKEHQEIVLKLMRGCENNYIDTAADYISAGLYKEAEFILEGYLILSKQNKSPLPYYTMAMVKNILNREFESDLRVASQQDPTHFFPSTAFEYDILNWVITTNNSDFNAPYYLGNLLYDKKRKSDAINCWEMAETRGSKLSVVYRNLGIAYFNFEENPEKALKYYNKAFTLAPNDGRVLFELDQLKKKMNISIQLRKEFLLENYNLITERDDLVIEITNLYNLTEECDKVLKILNSRQFHPWEGGEGQVVGSWATSHLILGKVALKNRDYKKAINHFNSILTIPENLGESWHPLQNQSYIFFYLGLTYKAAGDKDKSDIFFKKSSEIKGDFSSMEVQDISENSYYTAKSMTELGHNIEAENLYRQMISYGEKQLKERAEIDYFATSLPLLLVFEDDITLRRDLQAKYIMALGYEGLENQKEFESLKKEILEKDICHQIGLL